MQHWKQQLAMEAAAAAGCDREATAAGRVGRLRTGSSSRWRSPGIVPAMQQDRDAMQQQDRDRRDRRCEADADAVGAGSRRGIQPLASGSEKIWEDETSDTNC
ncbi:hypothetical protein KSP39_PZI021498 [Platanthera zijinensis]|uniref:Uncharacterized protein n=1 Tax=Platanthera zijinensis TaxID=2320716 RepID=A0AAP0AZ68_9ASPA